MSKKEIISKEIVHKFFENAWAFVVPQGLKNVPLNNLKVADWEILSSAIKILFDSPTYKPYKLEAVTGESFYNLYHLGAGKKNRSLFILCLYLLIKKEALNINEYKYLEDFNENRFYFLQKLQDIFSTQILEQEPPIEQVNVDLSNDLIQNTENEGIKPNPKLPYYFVIFLGLAVLLIYALSKNDVKHKIEPNDPRIKFEVNNLTNNGIAPTDIIFSYDISAIDYDSAFIEFGDKQNPIKFPLKSPIGKIPHTFTHPQGRDVSLIIDSVKKVIFVPILSNGWFSKLDELYLSDNKFKAYGQLHIPEEQVPPQIIKDGEYYVSLQNLTNFECDADNLIFEARVKNPQEEGGISCFDISIDLNGILPNFEKGILSFNLVKPKCTRFAHITAGKTEYPNPKTPNLLDSLGISVSNWVVVKVQTNNNRVRISVNDKILYNLPYTGKIGQLKFIQIFFKGTGSVDWVKISNLDNKIVYFDDF